MIKKPRIYEIQSEDLEKNNSENLGGIPLLKYLFSDFFRISFVVFFVYADIILLSYPFTFFPQYNTIGTIFGVFEDFYIHGGYFYITILSILEFVLINVEYKFYRRLWPKRF